MRKTITDLEKRLGVPRVGTFAVATAIGFLVSEAILAGEVLLLYHSTRVPDVLSASTLVLGLDVIAFGIGVTVAFFLNERALPRVPGELREGTARSVLRRWAKYQLIALGGNAIIVGVQLALLGEFSVSPVLGGIVGALASFPVSYLISMHFVWGSSSASRKGVISPEAHSI